jgi:hypothetical protein
MTNETRAFTTYHVCLPEHDADEWTEVQALNAEEAVLMHAEQLCKRDPDWYRAFLDGPTVLARADGDREIQRFEVELEQVPLFSSRRTGTCG